MRPSTAPTSSSWSARRSTSGSATASSAARRAPRRRRVVHVADSPGQLSTHAELAASVAGDLSSVLDGLVVAVQGRRDRARLVRLGQRARRRRQGRRSPRDNELLTAEADPIHPARIYGELVPRLADDAVVIGDGGDFVSFAGKFVEPKRPGGWLDPGPYGCLGAGLGAAIAARLARPSAQVALLLGDGAAGFSLMDVDTLVRHDLPVVMVMGNNSAWGLEKGPMQMLYGYDVAADLAQQTSYHEVVKALGGAGEKVSDPKRDRPRARPRLRLGRALPRQHHHRRRRRLPAQHLRDLMRWSCAGSGPRSTTVPASVCVAAYEPFFTGAEDFYVERLHDVALRDARGRGVGGRDEDGQRARLRHLLPARVAVARDRDATDEGEFRMLAVDPAARGRGVGDGAGASVRGPRARHGATAMALSSLATMTAAHRVYERLGYRATRSRLVAVDCGPRVPERLHLIAYVQGAVMTARDPARCLVVTDDDTAEARRQRVAARARHPAAAGMVRGRDVRGPSRPSLARGVDQRRHPHLPRAPRRQPGRRRAGGHRDDARTSTADCTASRSSGHAAARRRTRKVVGDRRGDPGRGRRREVHGPRLRPTCGDVRRTGRPGRRDVGRPATPTEWRAACLRRNEPPSQAGRGFGDA